MFLDLAWVVPTNCMPIYLYTTLINSSIKESELNKDTLTAPFLGKHIHPSPSKYPLIKWGINSKDK